MVSLTLDWLHIIILLGALQAGFLGVALVTKRTNRTANRLLAAMVAAFAIYLLTSVYHAMGAERVAPHFFGLAFPMPFLYGPLVYLYALCAADRDRRLTRRDALHFVPFVAIVVAGLPIYMKSGDEKIAFYHALLAGKRTWLVAMANPLKVISGVIYAVATLRFLRRHREQVKQSYSSTEHVNLRWLLWLGLSAAAIWVVAVLFEVLESAGIAHVARGDDVISLGIAVLVFGIGFRGLQQPEIFRYETGEFPTSTTPASPALVVEDEPIPRYERSGLTERESRRIEQALRSLMDEQRPWTDSELTLADLAARLGTTPHKLSEVLNAQVGQTFYDFVNGYRVREVQRRIAAGDAERLKILTLAFEAGFASKSTFNEVFKRHTSQTPSAYRRAAGA